MTLRVTALPRATLFGALLSACHVAVNAENTLRALANLGRVGHVGGFGLLVGRCKAHCFLTLLDAW